MPVFEFKALDSQGKTHKGVVDADSEQQVRSRLRSKGLFPVSIGVSNARPTADKAAFSLRLSRISAQEVAAFTRNLATLLDAGIPLVPALDSLLQQSRRAAEKRLFADLKGAVNEGTPFSQALQAWPRLFSPVYVNMVRAGEASGTLHLVLEKLADLSERQAFLEKRLWAALTYPLFMAFTGCLILLLLITKVLPNITQVFADMERALPLPTVLLLALSDFLQQHWGGLVLLIIVGLVAGRFLLQTGAGRDFTHRLRLRLPLLGPVLHKALLARFTATLGGLLSGGVGLLASLQIVRALVDNVHVGAVVDRAMDQVERGRPLSAALKDSQWFPPMLVQMIEVGEQSGSLEKMLERSSSSFEREVETAVLSLTSLLEPLLILVMGLAVGGIVLAILLPIFEMNQLIG